MSVVVGVESSGGFSNEEILNVRFPLHRACRDGDVGALCALLQRCTDTAHLNAEDSVYGWSPIHWAAHFGKLECVMRLVQVGCEVNAITTKFAQTPAHIAAFGGHPECVLWLLQAGADVNRQDYVGETPIHKAARAGSMDCIKALLLQGAKPHLRNASGLTAADLAHAQGFHECSQLLTNAQNHLIQLNGFHANGTLNGNTNLSQGQSLLANGAASRKRLLNDMETVHVKKARTDVVDLSMRMLQNGGGEELESMHVESAQDLHSEEDPKATSNGHSLPNTGSTNGHYDAPPHVNGSNGVSAQWRSPTTVGPPRSTKSELSLPLTNQESSSSGQTALGGRCPTDMCGSLHLTESPSSCVAYRPAWGMMGSDAGDSLHYGHYHGFGDTAEDLTETTSRLEHSGSVYAEQHYNQAMVNTMQLFHGS